MTTAVRRNVRQHATHFFGLTLVAVLLPWAGITLAQWQIASCCPRIDACGFSFVLGTDGLQCGLADCVHPAASFHDINDKDKEKRSRGLTVDNATVAHTLTQIYSLHTLAQGGFLIFAIILLASWLHFGFYLPPRLHHHRPRPLESQPLLKHDSGENQNQAMHAVMFAVFSVFPSILGVIYCCCFYMAATLPTNLIHVHGFIFTYGLSTWLILVSGISLLALALSVWLPFCCFPSLHTAPRTLIISRSDSTSSSSALFSPVPPHLLASLATKSSKHNNLLMSQAPRIIIA